MSVTVIAELSLNHGGNVDVAYEMIRAAKDAGVDGVKLQTHRTHDFLPEGHKDWEMFHTAEIWPHIRELVRYAHDLGLIIGTTPTGFDGVEEAVAAGVDFLKNGSDFGARHDLIEAMVATGLPVWVSTGMATEEEIEEIPEGVRLMLCTSLYPTPDDQVNLTRFADFFFRGFSDHTTDSAAGMLAVALGAEMLEKHLKLDDDCPDAAVAVLPEEMASYVRDIRRAETLLGVSVYPSPGEVANREAWRVTKETLRRG